VVVGADFDVDTAASGTTAWFYYVYIPSYNPAVYRAFHANKFMCIDFFAYKNCGSDNVRVQNVRSHMIIKSPLINVNEKEEEYHADLEAYGDQKGYQATDKKSRNES